MTLFRGMRPDGETGLPQVGNARNGLDVVAGDPPVGDIPVREGIVAPESGGMSVVTDDPILLPVHRKPKSLGGTAKGYTIYAIEEIELPRTLVARQDKPEELPAHRSIEPRTRCTFISYREAIHATRNNWKSVDV